MGGNTLNSSQLYKSAYDAHYQNNDYDKALELYRKVLEDFPESNESEYAKNQIVNLEKNKDKLKAKFKTHYTESESAIKHCDVDNIKLTTAHSLEGHMIVDTIEIITSECALGMDIISDFITGISDIFGGRSRTIQNSLREARQSCLYELKREASELGANAVIAVDLKYSEFSGKGKSMLFVVASGTAVIVEKAGNEKYIQSSDVQQI